jgi:hypothetical protein
MKTFKHIHIGLFVLGYLLGIISFNILYMQQMEKIMKTNEQLISELKVKKIKLENLQQTQQKNQTPIIDDIVLILENKAPEIIPKSEIEQYIKILLNHLIGKPLNTIDGQLIYKSLNKRIFRFEDGQYQLEIRCIIVAETVYIYYTACKDPKSIIE